MKKQKLICSLSFVLVTLAGACTEGPVAPMPAAPPESTAPGLLSAEYECFVDVEAGTTRCGAVPPANGGAQLALSLGSGPLTFISHWTHARTWAMNEDTSTSMLAFVNNTVQPLGTIDGESVHPDGIRLVFTTPPYVASVYSGTVAGASIRMETPTGRGTFTDGTGAVLTDRPYFQYNTIFMPHETSNYRFIHFIYSSNVKGFGYRYRVWAPVQFEHGWLDLSWTGKLDLFSSGYFVAEPYSAVAPLANEPVTWSSSHPDALMVDPSTGAYTVVKRPTNWVTITARSTVDPQRTGEISIWYSGWY